MHVVVSKQGRGRRRLSFDAVAQINRRQGVRRASEGALLAVIGDLDAKRCRGRVFAEIIENIDTKTAIATLRVDQLAALTVSLGWPDGYPEWIIIRTLNELRNRGYLHIDWPTRRCTSALDSNCGAAQ